MSRIKSLLERWAKVNEGLERGVLVDSIIEAIKTVNKRWIKMSPGLQNFLDSKPMPFLSTKYYEALTHEMKKLMISNGESLCEAEEIWKMTREEYRNKYGKRQKNTTVTGGFCPHKEAVMTALNQGKNVPKEVLADYPELKESLSEAGEVAHTILQQLGGNKFIAMTGAKNMGYSDEDHSLSFKIGRNSGGVSHVKITLNGKDLYDMKFLNVRGATLKVVKEVKDVYNDQLQNIFTEVTGMDTHL